MGVVVRGEAGVLVVTCGAEVRVSVTVGLVVGVSDVRATGVLVVPVGVEVAVAVSRAVDWEVARMVGVTTGSPERGQSATVAPAVMMSRTRMAVRRLVMARERSVRMAHPTGTSRRTRLSAV